MCSQYASFKWGKIKHYMQQSMYEYYVIYENCNVDERSSSHVLKFVDLTTTCCPAKQ
jgi:hypothetical protein